MTISVIHPRWIITGIPDQPSLTGISCVLDGDHILELLPEKDARRKYPEAIQSDAPHRLLAPGLHNGHGHTPMVLLRGRGADLKLMDWLNQEIWPIERKIMGEEYVYAGALIGYAEQLLSGIVSVNDMYFYPEASARAARRVGIRARLGCSFIDEGSPGRSSDALMKAFPQIVEDHDDFIKWSLAPHAPYTVSDDTLKRVMKLAEKFEVPIHMHIHESREEVRDSRPLARLEKLGLLDHWLYAVHMTQLSEDELSLLEKKSQLTVVHCPESNLKLGSGIAPLKSLLDRKIPTIIGTDGAASNDDLDVLGELRTAGLLAKGATEDSTAAPCHELLSMATSQAAESLGWPQSGRIEEGALADLVLFNLSDSRCRPVNDPQSCLIYSASRRDIDQVWIAGKKLVEGGRLVDQGLQQEVSETLADWESRIEAIQGPS